MEKEWYTPQEVADMYNVKRLTVYRWIKKGLLPIKKEDGKNGKGHVYINAKYIPKLQKICRTRRTALERDFDELLTLED